MNTWPKVLVDVFIIAYAYFSRYSILITGIDLAEGLLTGRLYSILWVIYLDAVFSVKIRKELKEKMDKYKNKVNWAEEIRRFIEETIRRLEAESNFGSVLKRLETASWDVPRGFSTSSVREDRDSS